MSVKRDVLGSVTGSGGVAVRVRDSRGGAVSSASALSRLGCLFGSLNGLSALTVKGGLVSRRSTVHLRMTLARVKLCGRGLEVKAGVLLFSSVLCGHFLSEGGCGVAKACGVTAKGRVLTSEI